MNSNSVQVSTPYFEVFKDSEMYFDHSPKTPENSPNADEAEYSPKARKPRCKLTPISPNVQSRRFEAGDREQELHLFQRMRSSSLSLSPIIPSNRKAPSHLLIPVREIARTRVLEDRTRNSLQDSDYVRSPSDHVKESMRYRAQLENIQLNEGRSRDHILHFLALWNRQSNPLFGQPELRTVIGEWQSVCASLHSRHHWFLGLLSLVIDTLDLLLSVMLYGVSLIRVHYQVRFACDIETMQLYYLSQLDKTNQRQKVSTGISMIRQIMVNGYILCFCLLPLVCFLEFLLYMMMWTRLIGVIMFVFFSVLCSTHEV